MSQDRGEMDGILRDTAAGHRRLLAGLRHWREEMPDALLRACVAPATEGGDMRDLVIDPERVSHNQLMAQVHYTQSKRLRDHPLEPLLRSTRLRTGLRNKKLLQERDDILSRLGARGVQALIFKGGDLAFSAYPDPCCRVVGDLDLLVEQAQFQTALQVLLSEGFQPDVPLAQGQGEGQETTSWTHPEYGVSLDVQLHINHHARWSGVDQLYFDHAVRRGDGSGMLGLCREHAVVQVCGHGLSQNYYPPVRWATDAVWSLRAGGAAFDWDLVLAAVRHNRGAPIVRVALQYLRLVLDVPVPGSVLEALRVMPARRTFRTAWAYRLDAPQGPMERSANFASRFREIHPDRSGWGVVGQVPRHLRETQSTTSAVGAVVSLIHKAITNKTG